MSAVSDIVDGVVESARWFRERRQQQIVIFVESPVDHVHPATLPDFALNCGLVQVCSQKLTQLLSASGKFLLPVKVNTSPEVTKGTRLELQRIQLLMSAILLVDSSDRPNKAPLSELSRFTSASAQCSLLVCAIPRLVDAACLDSEHLVGLANPNA